MSTYSQGYEDGLKRGAEALSEAKDKSLTILCWELTQLRIQAQDMVRRIETRHRRFCNCADCRETYYVMGRVEGTYRYIAEAKGVNP